MKISAWGLNKENNFWEYQGSNTCRWMFKDHLEAVKDIAQETALAFPDRQDSRLIVMDNSPSLSHEVCPGHPEGSHRDKLTFDMRYYTMTDNSVPDFWKGGNLTDNFDVERNKWFFNALKERFPDFLGRTHPDIWQALDRPNYMLRDTVAWYHHNTHSHCSLGLLINQPNTKPTEPEWVTCECCNGLGKVLKL